MFLKYFDQGYLTIPVRPNSKASALPAGYSLYEWSQNGLSYETFEKWEEEYPCPSKFGIALVCGKASNVVAVDIDTDDPRVIELIPESPCEKVGERPTRFFRYSEAFAQKINVGKNEGKTKDHVEFLTNGQYCILPPSIHPDTKKAYFWTTEESILYVPGDELPELTLDVVTNLQAYYAKKYGEAMPEGINPPLDLSKKFVSETMERCPHGSHDRLKQFAATLIRQETFIGDAIRELYEYDEEHHKPIGYFSDPSRGADSRLDPHTNAARFYVKQLEFIQRKRMLEGDGPHNILALDFIIELPGGEQLKIDLKSLSPYPKARGLMAQVQDYMQLVSPFKQDAISLGGALALMSILCANKFRTQVGHFDIRPNLYVLNLAKSGAGKEGVQSFIMDILSQSGLLGSGGYKSATSIVQSLPTQQERLNIIDEASAWLKSIGEGEGFQQEMNDVLSGLFTRSNGYFPGISLAREKSDKLGACWNPSLTILASTTLHGFKTSVNQSMGAKGLMPRFLTFWQHSLGEYKTPTRSSVLAAGELKRSIIDEVGQILKIEKRLHPAFEMAKMIELDIQSGEIQNCGKRYDPKLIPMSDEAVDRYFEYAKEKAPKDTLLDSFDEPFLNRHAELAGKLALLDTVSRGEFEITLESLVWAIKVVEVEWTNVHSIFKETSAENATERSTLRVLEVIKAAGGEMSKSDLTNATHWLTKIQRNQILEDLRDAGSLEQFQKTVGDSKKPSTYFRAIIR